jgi:hypothetical protein
MNMQDYRHAADRVHIAAHCKEEVLGMKKKTAEKKPMIRIVTGITAAAACLSITGAFGYALFNMKKESAQLPAATSIEAESQLEEQILTADSADDYDNREFPLFSRMTEEQQVRTFDWGTIRLESCGLSGTSLDEKRRMQVKLHVHLNDGIEINAGDAVWLTLSQWMYDTEMQHKVSYFEDGGYVTSQPTKNSDNPREIDFLVEYPAPIADGTTCLTLGEDGEYHNIETDFLEKQPMPEYLLYELQLERLSILRPREDAVVDDNESESASEATNRTVIFEEEHTPLFKFRMEDLPTENDEKIGVSAEEAAGDQKTAESTEYSSLNLLDAQSRTREFSFGTVTLEGMLIDECATMPTLILQLNHNIPFEKGQEMVIRITPIGYDSEGNRYEIYNNEALQGATYLYGLQDETDKQKFVFTRVISEPGIVCYHETQADGSNNRLLDWDEVKWADLDVELHLNTLLIRKTAYDMSKTPEGMEDSDELTYKWENKEIDHIVPWKFSLNQNAEGQENESREQTGAEEAYPSISSLNLKKLKKELSFGTLSVESCKLGDDGKVHCTFLVTLDEAQNSFKETGGVSELALLTKGLCYNDDIIPPNNTPYEMFMEFDGGNEIRFDLALTPYDNCIDIDMAFLTVTGTNGNESSFSTGKKNTANDFLHFSIDN